MQLSHKLHSIFVWNCRTAVKPYKLAEISVLFSKLSQNHLQSNAKKGILKEKEKRKNGQKGEVEHMKEKETTNAMSCPTKSPEASSPPENDSVRSHLSGAGGRRDHPDDTRDASDDAGGWKRATD